MLVHTKEQSCAVQVWLAWKNHISLHTDLLRVSFSHQANLYCPCDDKLFQHEVMSSDSFSLLKNIFCGVKYLPEVIMQGCFSL